MSGSPRQADQGQPDSAFAEDDPASEATADFGPGEDDLELDDDTVDDQGQDTEHAADDDADDDRGVRLDGDALATEQDDDADDDADDEDEDALRDGEFVCRSCQMAKRESALADEDAMLCRDCL